MSTDSESSIDIFVDSIMETTWAGWLIAVLCIIAGVIIVVGPMIYKQTITEVSVYKYKEILEIREQYKVTQPSISNIVSEYLDDKFLSEREYVLIHKAIRIYKEDKSAKDDQNALAKLKETL
jgi:hypothetical protein